MNASSGCAISIPPPILPHAQHPSLPPPLPPSSQTARPQVPTKTSGKSYQICGVISQVDDNTLEITELPIRKWTQARPRGEGATGSAGAAAPLGVG